MRGNFVKVDLYDYFNSKLFLNKDEVEKSTALLKYVGARNQTWHLFCSDSLPGSLETTNVLNTPFIFPDKAYDKFDSISCEGQIINLEEDKYKVIHLLGTAFDDVYCYEKLKVTYTDDSFAEKDIYFKEWAYLPANTSWEFNDSARPKCLIGIKGQHLSDFTVRCIYYNRCELTEKDKVIKKIELPYNPDLYIFGITLEL
jgi:hypothetical protein